MCVCAHARVYVWLYEALVEVRGELAGLVLGFFPLVGLWLPGLVISAVRC